MPGVSVGEIGNKVGFNCVNNGFLGFENVRIPLKNMLMRFAKVLENGEFIKPKSQVLTYGTMTLLRVIVVRDQALFLSKAVTIAMRYSLVRRQSPIDPNQPEPKIIEHFTQQMKVFPMIAKVIVIKAAAENLFKLYQEAMSCLEKGDLSRLPEMHSLSCCLKSASTDEVVNGVQTCRLACGGHGYLNSSGFNDIYGCVVAAQHYEGDNTIMYLQTARFLMKAWDFALKGVQLTPTVAYLNEFLEKQRAFSFENSPKGILRALKAAAAGKVESTFKLLESRKKLSSLQEASNQTGPELVKAAEIHCQVFLLQTAIEYFEYGKRNTSRALGEALDALLEIYSTDLAQRMLGTLLQFTKITSKDIIKLQERLEANLKKFRNSAIGIVDGFDIRDEILGSTLGANDGNVYERLLGAAKASPLNQEDVNKSFELHLKPFMKSNL
jgi:acyl-CoA oxidase